MKLMKESVDMYSGCWGCEDTYDDHDFVIPRPRVPASINNNGIIRDNNGGIKN